ncbi:putative quinol monooxygenase [Histidinibacterium aquaticum]|uniref:Antibiotic biosynthesis monooxygenase n=1 Tax=Histidinibacterium aquaticum TaxID=2613962 RepID=A0A5J5GPA9_9RHOB|nr:putative quinol monooxygenase [Histidinibacterium aquaticum]KAA9009897.1 antibiotic biosynthesis monooxygenase [Histidinibacterium aquaticum]
MPLTIVADIHAEPGRADRLLERLQMLVAPTRAEAGCLAYDLHRDDTDPDHFLFYETWETREHWLAHMESDHIKAHGPATEGLVARADVWEMSKLD